MKKQIENGLGSEKPQTDYPAVIMVLLWHCYGITCAECGDEFHPECILRNIIREYVKGFLFVSPSLS
jgi:hypothetical protein